MQPVRNRLMCLSLIIRCAVIMACFFLLSCSSVVEHPTPLNAIDIRSHDGPLPEYIIMPGDQLSVKFYENQSLNENILVRPDGRISLQLIDEIIAAGKTPAELTGILRDKYTAEFKNPRVTVIVRTFSLQKIYVTGEVNLPNVVDLKNGFSVLQAIAQVGGFTDTAHKNEVVLIRKKADGRPQVFQLDLEKVIDGTDMSQDITLQPLDVVFVPKSHIANVNLWVDQYITRILPFWGVSFSYELNQ